MVKLIVSALFLMLIWGPSLRAQTITIAYYNAYPHMYVKDMKPTGPGIDYITEVARNVGLEVEFVNYPVKRTIRQLQDRKVDAIIGLIKNEDRQRYLAFSEVPIVSATPCLITNDEILKSKEKTLEDGGTLLIPANFILSDVVTKKLKNFDLTYVNNKNPMKKILELLDHRKNIYGLVQVCLPNVYHSRFVRTILLEESRIDFFMVYPKDRNSEIREKIDTGLKDMISRKHFYLDYLRRHALEINK
jgi:hypothetical protein